ncbi:carboxypeptidase PM20D1 [Litorivivens lipolytica]|uniref:Carboxypeptidase PM20D1 n=1 Tax=Litorivivens lipolytica TaxID=1524264 RepID=A0A7W4Z4Z1_9GAMM|nr:M20 family peptidase [Litorivivens lipolytica]MBB3046638.1 carboxypeptidase PM20D1 [Litorivivens lipolytica]
MKFLKWIGVLLVVLAVVLLVRTQQFKPVLDEQASAVDLGRWDEQYLAQGLAKSLTFPTVSSGDPREFDLQPFFAFQEYLKQRFPKTFAQIPYEVINEATLLFRWQGQDTSRNPIILLSHQDVVPVIPGTEEEWTYPPYAGTVADGYIWGRGAIDDKAGVVGILEAVERHLAEGFVPPRTIYLAFGHDEEVGGNLGAVAIADLFKQRGETLDFLLDEGGVIAKDMVPGVEKRIALIGPGEKGYVSLKLSARGTGGHSSMPPMQTAAGRVGRAVHRLEQHPFPVDLDYTVEFMRFLGEDQPFFQRLLFANAWLFSPLLTTVLENNPATNAGIRTTTAVTMLQGSVRDNVLPIKASAVVNFRILPGDTVESVMAYVKEVVDDPAIKIAPYDGFGSNPSPVADTSSAGFQVLSDVVRQVSPETIVAPRLVMAATDARHFSEVAKNSYRFMGVEVSPRELAGIHGTDERVSVSSYTEAVKMYYALIARADEL